MSLPLLSKIVVGAFAGSGVIHLVRPQVFEPIVPKMLPAKRELVYISGVAELACAAGLVVPKTRSVAGLASAGLLVAVLPANVQMAVDAWQAAERKPTPQRRAMQVGTIARLPLQWPLIKGALAARSS
ncbi:DoxX family protein [Branchiibius sp. NY16-3462-2]|uniref:DoxX family protein n=1 Tax=Branchiibius sp. NY16-3462-2 TaxID=1807500 RepID=UPI0007981759|nr:DoxX family protein [Branchiibius sp. NY16-3462-2]KYH43165.1 DoxX family protein [Branchiibius sp. NY16-3462-2]